MTRREWQPIFLDALRNSANVRAACLTAHIGRTQAYRVRAQSEAFAKAWDEAIGEAVDTLEAEAWRRARSGTKREVTHYWQGIACGTDVITEYSDLLLIFLLKAHRPAMYRETTRHELTGAGGGPIQNVTVSQLDAELADLCAEMAGREKAASDSDPQ